MKKRISLLLVALLYCSNAHAEDSPDDDNGSTMSNGLSTVGAILTGALLSPFVKAYDKLTDAEGKIQREHQRRADLFNPLYEEKIQALQGRDPQQDAQAVFERDGVIYIPRVRGSYSYAGFPWDQPPVEDYQQNNAKLAANPLIREFEHALYGVDEAALGESIYTHDAYDTLTNTYKERFNQTMQAFQSAAPQP